MADGVFFNRAPELGRLRQVLGSPPTSVLVLTGPPSCGKSDYLSPAAFSVNLLSCLSNDWRLEPVDLLRAVLPSSVKLAGSAVGVLSLDLVKEELLKEPTPLQVSMDAYLKLARDAKRKRESGNGCPWPVIIIDEANRLTAWKDKESLEQLLAFFVYLTKQEQLAHVVLATSDTFLVEWLESGPVKAAYRRPTVVGNLSKDAARDFFLQHVLPRFSGVPPDACSVWERIYEVCGGNPGLLYICASDAAAFGSWETACASIVQTATTDITKGLSPSTWEGAAWTTDDCRSVLQLIASSPHAAVPAAQLEAHLGLSLFGLRLFGWGGAQKLQSMHKMNLLVRRSYDPLARDIDAAAFGPDLEDVYTLPSAAHVIASRRKLKLGLE